MRPERIERLTDPADILNLVGMLCRAFEQDAHFAWLVRQDAHREVALRELLAMILIDLAGEGGEVHATADRAAAAFWYRPGTGRLDWSSQLRFLRRYLAIAGWSRLASRGMAMNLLQRRHPKAPHYHLQVLGVDPSCQGRGYGAALLRSLLARCDEQRVPAYLETGNAGNLRFYQYHGFSVHRRHQMPGGLTLWSMVRPPHGGGDGVAGRVVNIAAGQSITDADLARIPPSAAALPDVEGHGRLVL